MGCFTAWYTGSTDLMDHTVGEISFSILCFVILFIFTEYSFLSAAEWTIFRCVCMINRMKVDVKLVRTFQFN